MYGTAGHFIIRSNIRLPKMEHPKFEGHVMRKNLSSENYDIIGYYSILSTQHADSGYHA